MILYRNVRSDNQSSTLTITKSPTTTTGFLSFSFLCTGKEEYHLNGSWWSPGTYEEMDVVGGWAGRLLHLESTYLIVLLYCGSHFLVSSTYQYTRRTVQSIRNNMFRVCRMEYALLWIVGGRGIPFFCLFPVDGHFLCATINLDTHMVHRGSSDAELCGSLPVCQPPKCIGGLFVCLSRSSGGGGLLVHCCLMMIKMINTT